MKGEKQSGKPEENNEIPMLPVWMFLNRKPKLPKAFAWVAGVERLSKRFADVPQFHNLSVCFDDHPLPNWRPTMTRIVAENLPYPVFTVRYSLIGLRDWRFYVYPVDAKLRHFIRNLLEETAFPIVEQWMKTERTEVWLSRDHHLHCIWNPVAGDITVKEE